MARLQIYNPTERALVALADAALAPIGWFGRLRRQFRRSKARSGQLTDSGRPELRAGDPNKVLLLRLERIGDLLMVMDAIGDVRRAWPDAEIDLAVGSWNADLARLIPDVTRLQVADAPWLSRGAGASWRSLFSQARAWRRSRYDLVINFEPDIRSNLLAWLSGAPRRFGYWTGGGGALLTSRSAYAPLSHVSDNARRLVARAARRQPVDPADRSAGPRLVPPPDAVARASALLGGATRPIVGVHASGGRESKQWHLDRFAEVARRLAAEQGATIVLTGSESDRPMVDEVRAALGATRVIDAAGALDLPSLAALLGRLDVLVTGDTGPMHLAAAMGTPVVALFGPSHVERYGPLAPRQRILRVDLPCSPCGQVRMPPERCRGHVPDCMDGIQVDAVVRAAEDLLRA
jgi:lipopolysaccharide heptosyltransferase II